ncbi:gp436 family protein [Gallaecimonas xiamenensis]|uniref:Mu-like prophage protein gp36 n=1 Tax=Gallaecimonas xiamenensis 3-C-1 TaxID=745411 RepID=K2JY35_9GAMM|nr:phage protein Gp36 family protein [Gallaecimonas xiamenensis]EKE75189.1 hypothetical protein B3C1_07931 [Gallaecimonas xiamenensis 3-C-1]
MYAALADMQARFGEVELVDLTDRTGTGAIDQAVLDNALDDAAATIDGYLGARYPLPLATVPAVLTRVACDLARYYLYDERATEAVTKRHDDALKMLRSIGDGTVTLGLPDAQTPEGSNTSTIESAGSVWGRANSKGFL